MFLDLEKAPAKISKLELKIESKCGKRSIIRKIRDV